MDKHHQTSYSDVCTILYPHFWHSQIAAKCLQQEEKQEMVITPPIWYRGDPEFWNPFGVNRCGSPPFGTEQIHLGIHCDLTLGPGQ